MEINLWLMKIVENERIAYIHNNTQTYFDKNKKNFKREI